MAKLEKDLGSFLQLPCPTDASKATHVLKLLGQGTHEPPSRVINLQGLCLAEKSWPQVTEMKHETIGVAGPVESCTASWKLHVRDEMDVHRAPTMAHKSFTPGAPCINTVKQLDCVSMLVTHREEGEEISEAVECRLLFRLACAESPGR